MAFLRTEKCFRFYADNEDRLRRKLSEHQAAFDAQFGEEGGINQNCNSSFIPNTFLDNGQKSFEEGATLQALHGIEDLLGHESTDEEDEPLLDEVSHSKLVTPPSKIGAVAAVDYISLAVRETQQLVEEDLQTSKDVVIMTPALDVEELSLEEVKTQVVMMELPLSPEEAPPIKDGLPITEELPFAVKDLPLEMQEK